MAQLDKKKPYGEVFGQHAYRFEQDGKLFDASGDECDENGKKVEAKKGGGNTTAPKTVTGSAKATPAGKNADQINSGLKE